MYLPLKESLSDQFIIDVMNARCEEKSNELKGWEKDHVYDLIRSIYYGDDTTLHMSYTKDVINVLKIYDIIGNDETIQTLIYDGKVRANDEISKAFSSDEVQGVLKDIIKTVYDAVSNIKNDFNTSEIARKKIYLN